MSPYQYAALNPISFIDLNGDSVWVKTNDEDKTHTIHFQGKVINASNSDIPRRVLNRLRAGMVSGLKESYSGDLSDGYSIEVEVDLEVVSSMDEITTSDHVVAIYNLDRQSHEAGKFVPGMVNKMGGKVIYLNQRSFEGKSDNLPRITRTALHEWGHTMGLDHTKGIFYYYNLMRGGGRHRDINNNQRVIIIKNRNSFNQGVNKLGPYLLPAPTTKPTIY